MSTNPLYKTNDSPNNQTQPTKAVNRQGVSVHRTHNTFDNSYFHFKTQKFGQYEPFFVMEGVPGDMIPLHSSHNVRTLPMSSPFLSELKLNKDYFMVPMNAILPNTWDYIFKTPAQGDDVPDDANCLCPLFATQQDYTFIEAVWRLMQQDTTSERDRLRLLLILEMFLSQGSLLAQLGYHLNPKITLSQTGGSPIVYNFDQFFDFVFRSIERIVILDTDTNISYYTGRYDASVSSFKMVSIYQILNLLRSYGSRFIITDLYIPQQLETDFSLYSLTDLPVFVDSEEVGTDLNLSRLFAYQMSCCQFYVNPQVDFLYNAQLYRDNLYTLYESFMVSAGLNSSTKYFTLNGIYIPYDYTSKVYITDVLSVILDTPGNLDTNAIAKLYDYLYAIFGHRESLRFGDYFTDSRTRPLAVGSDSIQVSQDNSVSVVDVSKSIVYQRFRNAVVKLGNNIGDYLRGIFGSDPSPDYHVPKFISHQDFDISGFEVANQTSQGQGQLVTNLSSRDDTFAFEVQVDMSCVLIGISYFSLPRVYMQTKDRHFFHRDRYDMFNPMLQYIGDQIVYNHERTDLRPGDEIFGYQSRNNEYKQRYSVVSGGFATKLPGWTFVADSLFDPIDDVFIPNTQSPDFIRAHDYEFNRFFLSMSGFSLANSFHFIVVYNNKCMSNRPMEINPNIL